MDKKHKRLVKKRNAKKSNRPTNPKLAGTKQIPKSTEPEPERPHTENPTPPEKSVLADSKKDKKKSPPWKVVGFLISLVALLIGFLGYDALWPKVVIDSSSATDEGLLSYQFSFANQACYPVKVKTVLITAIDLKWPFLPVPGRTSTMHDIGLKSSYADVQIGGREAIGMKFDYIEFKNVGKLIDGSKMKIKITYQLPLIGIERSDSAFFESAEDNSGNPIWVKKPLGIYATNEALTVLVYDGTNEIY